MKRTYIIFLLVFLLIPSVQSSVVNVSVPEVLEGRVTSFFLNETYSPGLIKATLEFNNIGSVSFGARVRMEVFSDDRVIYDLWSDEKELGPSEKKVFELVFPVNQTGHFIVSTRIYYGGEILQYRDTNFEVTELIERKDVFDVQRVRASSDYIKFDLRSEENVCGIFILFSNYPVSWIVEQKKIGTIKKYDRLPVKVKYSPVDFSGKKIKLHIFSEDGRFYSSEQIILKSETGLEKIFNNFLDFINRVL